MKVVPAHGSREATAAAAAASAVTSPAGKKKVSPAAAKKKTGAVVQAKKGALTVDHGFLLDSGLFVLGATTSAPDVDVVLVNVIDLRKAALRLHGTPVSLAPVVHQLASFEIERCGACGVCMCDWGFVPQ